MSRATSSVSAVLAIPRLPRIAGWLPLPLRCPHCERRIKQDGVMLHGGVLHCVGCARSLYVILVPGANVAFIAELHPDEMRALHLQGANPIQVLAFLGVTVRAA